MSAFDLIAAPFTAFKADGSLELRAVERQAEALVRDGVRGAFVCGTTGEGASLTTAERMTLAERWCAAAGSSLQIIVHAGHASLVEARALAAHAEKVGAAGVAALGPYFFKPSTVEELVGCVAEVAVAAPETPFYYYHIPSLTGVFLSMADFLPEARARIPNLAGLKFTHEDLFDYGRCLDASGGLEVFFGRDEILLAGLALGARSAVGSNYNFAAPLYRRVADAFHRGDIGEAREAQRCGRDLIAVGLRYGGLPAFKAMMAWVRVDCGPCRLPLPTLGREAARAMRAELEERGVLEPAFGAALAR